MADQWLSIVEYARETGISDMTIRRRIRTGRISAELRDGKYFIPVKVDQSNGHITPVKSVSRSAVNNAGSIVPMKAHPSPDRTMPRVVPAAEATELHVRAPETLQHQQLLRSPAVEANLVGQQPTATNTARPSTSAKIESGFVPESLVNPLVDAGMASVEARGLIEFCHGALEQARATVASVEARYASRLEALNAQISKKDQELKSLHQQVEDLQLLVQILERKK